MRPGQDTGQGVTPRGGNEWQGEKLLQYLQPQGGVGAVGKPLCFAACGLQTSSAPGYEAPVHTVSFTGACPAWDGDETPPPAGHCEALTLSSSFTRIRTRMGLLLGFWSIFLCRVHRSIPER